MCASRREGRRATDLGGDVKVGLEVLPVLLRRLLLHAAEVGRGQRVRRVRHEKEGVDALLAKLLDGVAAVPGALLEVHDAEQGLDDEEGGAAKEEAELLALDESVTAEKTRRRGRGRRTPGSHRMRKRTKGPSGVGMRLKKVWRERAICVTEWHSLTISGTIWAAEQPAGVGARERRSVRLARGRRLRRRRAGTHRCRR